MSTYQNMNDDREFLKTNTKYDEIKDLLYKTEKHEREKILESLKIGNEYYRKKS